MSSKYMFDNIVSLSTTAITADFEDSFYPASNISKHRTVDEFRTPTGTTTSNLVIDAKNVRTATDIVIVGNNVTNEMNFNQVTLEGNPTNEWSSPAFSTTISDIDYEENIVFKSFTQQSFRFWRIVASSTSGFVGYSNVYLGDSLSTAGDVRSFNFGWEWGRIDRSIQKEGRYGQLFTDEINDQKTINADIDLMEDVTFYKFRQMVDYIGKTKGFYFIADVTESIIENKEVFAGYFQMVERPSFTNNFAQKYAASISIKEVI